jgi:hypothetical protein
MESCIGDLLAPFEVQPIFVIVTHLRVKFVPRLGPFKTSRVS